MFIFAFLRQLFCSHEWEDSMNDDDDFFIKIECRKCEKKNY